MCLCVCVCVLLCFETCVAWREVINDSKELAAFFRVESAGSIDYPPLYSLPLPKVQNVDIRIFHSSSFLLPVMQSVCSFSQEARTRCFSHRVLISLPPAQPCRMSVIYSILYRN
jgi:hypothetical protein